MKSLTHKTIKANSPGERDNLVNKFGEENYIKYSQSGVVDKVDGTEVWWSTLLYEDVGSISETGKPDMASITEKISNEQEFGASWDQFAHKEYNTFSVKKKSDNQYFAVPKKALEKIEANAMYSKWDFPKDNQRLVFKFNNTASKENKRPYWQVYVETK